MFDIVFFEACLANCLVKIAGARRFIFKWSFQLLVVKFKISSFSNKAALLIKQLIVPNFFLARGIIFSTCFIFFKSALIKAAFTEFSSIIFFKFFALKDDLK